MKYVVMENNKRKIKHCMSMSKWTMCGIRVDADEIRDEEEVEDYRVCENCKHTTEYKGSVYNDPKTDSVFYSAVDSLLKDCLRSSGYDLVVFKEDDSQVHAVPEGEDVTECFLGTHTEDHKNPDTSGTPFCNRCIEMLEAKGITVESMIDEIDRKTKDKDSIKAVQMYSYTKSSKEACIHLYDSNKPFSTLCHENITPQDDTSPEGGKPVCYKCTEEAEKKGINIDPYKTLPTVDPHQTVTGVVAHGSSNSGIYNISIEGDSPVTSITVNLPDGIGYTHTLKHPATVKDIINCLPPKE